MLRVVKGDIFITRGDTGYLQFIPEVQDPETQEFSPYEFEDGDSVIFRIQLVKGVFEKACQIELETNTCVLALVPDDTESLDFRTYYYEVELITNREEHFTFIANRRFTVEKEIERP